MRTGVFYVTSLKDWSAQVFQLLLPKVATRGQHFSSSTFFGNFFLIELISDSVFVLGVQELDSVINRCTAVLLGDLFP